LVLKVPKPNVDVDMTVIEHSVIPELPDLPSCNDRRLHEERDILLLPGMCHPWIQTEVIVPLNAYSLPTPLGECVAEEEMVQVLIYPCCA
jgi:hypothetical protein